MIRLGDVNFSLGADTARLRNSISILQAFGDQVDKMASATDTATQKVARALARQEKAAVSATNKVLGMNQAMRKVDGSEDYIRRANNALRQFNVDMVTGEKSALQYQRAVERFSTSLAGVQREFNAYAKASQHAFGISEELVTTMRNLATAAVLVSGPLGGIAARFIAFGTAIKTGGASMAAFLAGAASSIAIIKALGTAAVVAGGQFKQYEAVFSGLTNSSNAASNMFNDAINIARSAGQAIGTVVPMYARFEAALKGTSLEGERGYTVFKRFASVASVLNLTAEESSGIFRALEQMISKGTVQAEELKGQIGDRLPGALQIASRALGVTTAQLQAMMKNGSLITEDFLPKFAEEAAKTYGVGSGDIDNYVSSYNNMVSAYSQFGAALDKQLGVTDSIKSGYDLITEALDKMRANLGTVSEVAGAMLGAIAAIAAPTILTGFLALARVIKSVTAAMIGLNVATAANPFGAIAMVVTRLGIILAGSYIGMKLVDESINDVSISTQNATTSFDKWIDSTGRLVEATNSSAVAMTALAGVTTGTKKSFDDFSAWDDQTTKAFEDNTQKIIDSYNLRLREIQSQVQQLTANATGTQQLDIAQPAIDQLKAEYDRLYKLRQSILETVTRGQKGDLPEAGSSALARTAQELQDIAKAGKQADKILKDVEKLTAVNAQIAKGASLEEVLKTEDLEKAQQLLKDYNSTDLPELKKQLDAAGFAGATLADQLAQAITKQRQLGKSFDEFKATSKNPGKGIAAANRDDDALRDIRKEIVRTNTATEDYINGTQKLSRLEKLWDIEDKVQKYADRLRNAGVNTATLTGLTQQLHDALIKNFDTQETMKGWVTLKETLADTFTSATDSITEMATKGELSLESLADTAMNVAREILNEFIKLSIMNPLKNWLFNTNEPTMSFSQLIGNITGKTTTPTGSAAANAVNPSFTDYISGVLNKSSSSATTSNAAVQSRVNQAFDNYILGDSAMAIKGIESSGGNYGALGKILANGDRAYGAYQVMGSNVPSWSKKWYGTELTPNQFLNNPAAQDAVFKGQFGSYIDKYGPSGASRAWFAGEGNMNNLSAADANGMTVGQYQSQFNNMFGTEMPKAATALDDLSTNVATASTKFPDLSNSIDDVVSKWSLQGQSNTGTMGSMPASTPTGTGALDIGSLTGGSSGGGIFSSLFSGLGNIFSSLFSGLGSILKGIGSGFGSIFSGIFGMLGFADGGQINGKGTGTSDSNLIWASDGEYMVRESRARKYRGLLDLINYGNPKTQLAAFADGGMIGGLQASRSYMAEATKASTKAQDGANVQINIVQGDGTKATAQKRKTSQGITYDILVEQIRNDIAGQVASGTSGINQAMENRYALNPGQGLK